MSAAFSPDYVQQTIATSPANSLILWNGYFPLIEAETAPQAAAPSPATIPAIVPAKILAVTKATDAATKAAAKILPKVLKAGKLVTK